MKRFGQIRRIGVKAFDSGGGGLSRPLRSRQGACARLRTAGGKKRFGVVKGTDFPCVKITTPVEFRAPLTMVNGQ